MIKCLCLISIKFLLCETVLSLNLNNILFHGDFEFVDLSHAFTKDTIYWPNTKSFTVTSKAEYRADGYWYASNEFCAGEHGGTHLDAPYHFVKDGSFVGDIPLENLILPLIIADLTSKTNEDPNFVLTTEHLDKMFHFELAEQPCVVIFKFGWSKFYRDRHRYLGITSENGLNFPGLSGEVAEWIVTNYKNVVGVGVDTASVDAGSSTAFMAHKALLGAGLYLLENVRLDQYIPESGCTALVMPMKIKKGTGAPLRLVAICAKEKITYSRTTVSPYQKYPNP